MVAQEPKKENMATTFIGTIRANYTAPMWQADVQKWKDHLVLQKRHYEIPLMPLVINDQVLDIMDSSDAIPKIGAALEALNTVPVGEKIRLICLGTAHCHFLFQAIAHLLKEWKEPRGNLRPLRNKHVQFITSGDTRDRNMDHFCPWLCISGACHSIEFYNTIMYHRFGYCS